MKLRCGDPGVGRPLTQKPGVLSIKGHGDRDTEDAPRRWTWTQAMCLKTKERQKPPAAGEVGEDGADGPSQAQRGQRS